MALGTPTLGQRRVGLNKLNDTPPLLRKGPQVNNNPLINSFTEEKPVRLRANAQFKESPPSDYQSLKLEPGVDDPPIGSSDESSDLSSTHSAVSDFSEDQLAGSARTGRGTDSRTGVLSSNVEQTTDGGMPPAYYRKAIPFRFNTRKAENDGSDDELFAGINHGPSRGQTYMSSKKRSIKNLHISNTKPNAKRKKTQPAPTSIGEGEKGVRIGATLNDKAENEAIGFKDPNNLYGCKSPPKKGVRRSSRNAQAEEPPSRAFRQPPSIPTSQNPVATRNNTKFVVPLTVPSTESKGVAVNKFKNPPQETSERHKLAKFGTDQVSASSTLPSLSTDDADDVSPLSSPPTSPTLSASAQSIDRSVLAGPTLAVESQCPVCKEPISAALLDKFKDANALKKNNHRLTVRQQSRFCHAHKAEAARTTWESRGYPTIDWAGFPTRLESYRTLLQDLIDGRRQSPYRDLFNQKINNGNYRGYAQSLIKGTEDNESPKGYYGSKGARAMSDYVISSLSTSLRRLATTDHLVANGGVADFVQSVLVPELTVRLVMDDMFVDDETAGMILRESDDVGSLLCEDEDDVVKPRKRRRG